MPAKQEGHADDMQLGPKQTGLPALMLHVHWRMSCAEPHQCLCRLWWPAHRAMRTTTARSSTTSARRSARRTCWPSGACESWLAWRQAAWRAETCFKGRACTRGSFGSALECSHDAAGSHCSAGCPGSARAHAACESAGMAGTRRAGGLRNNQVCKIGGALQAAQPTPPAPWSGLIDARGLPGILLF